MAWLLLEESDNTPLRFDSYLTAALKAFGSRIGHSARALLEAPQSPTLEDVIALLINELGQLKQPGIDPASPDIPPERSGRSVPRPRSLSARVSASEPLEYRRCEKPRRTRS